MIVQSDKSPRKYLLMLFQVKLPANYRAFTFLIIILIRPWLDWTQTVLAPRAGSNTDGVLVWLCGCGSPAQIQFLAVAMLEFLIIFEQRTPPFHFAVSPANYVADPEWVSYLISLNYSFIICKLQNKSSTYLRDDLKKKLGSQAPNTQ